MNALHAFSKITMASREPGLDCADFAERVVKLTLQAYHDPAMAEANWLQQFICGLNDPGLQAKLLVKDVQFLKVAASHSNDGQRQHEALEAVELAAVDGTGIYWVSAAGRTVCTVHRLSSGPSSLIDCIRVSCSRDGGASVTYLLEGPAIGGAGSSTDSPFSIPNRASVVTSLHGRFLMAITAALCWEGVSSLWLCR